MANNKKNVKDAKKAPNTLVKDAIVLFLITLIAGCLLGLCNEVTKDAIKDAEEKAEQEAYLKVFNTAKTFDVDAAVDEKVENADQFMEDNNLSGATITKVRVAKDDAGEAIGYVISFVAKEGYGGDISLSMGMLNDGTITGLEVLSMSETAGLGAKCTESKFKDQFANINADEIVYTKDGKKEPNEIDALSSATITTKAVTKAVNVANTFIKGSIMQG